MWPLKTFLYFGFFWVTCAMALINPIWGVVNYMVVYQTDPTVTWWGAPLSDLGIRYSFTAAACTFAGLALARKRVPIVRPGFGWWECGILLIFAIACVSIVIGYGYSSGAQRDFSKLWKVLLFTLVLGRLAASRKNFHIVLWTLVAGSLYIGHDAYTAPARSFVMGRLERIGGPDFSTTSGAAAHLAAMLPLIGAAFLTSRNFYLKVLAAVSGAFTLNAIVLCRTRSAFIGLAIGALVALIAAPRAKRYRIHVLLVMGGIMAFSLTDDNFWKRMGTLTSAEALDNDLATTSRREIWATSFRIFIDHPTGIGVGNFQHVIGQYDYKHHKRSTHNSIVVCFVELGLQGGIVFLSLLVGSIVLIIRSSRTADDSDDPLGTRLLAYGLLISLVTYSVAALGTQRFYCESFWWVMVLPLALYRLVRVESQNRAAANEHVPTIEGAVEPDWDRDRKLVPELRNGF
jgi:O-Antigen ligase